MIAITSIQFALSVALSGFLVGISLLFRILMSPVSSHCRSLSVAKFFDVDPVARLESFRALKLSRLESFRALKC